MTDESVTGLNCWGSVGIDLHRSILVCNVQTEHKFKVLKCLRLRLLVGEIWLVNLLGVAFLLNQVKSFLVKMI